MTRWQPLASIEVLQARARIYHQIRHFFTQRDCLEVDTPLLSTATNTDVNIASIEASNFDQRYYLQTSPEFAMKRLLAAGLGSIFQICHAFRDEEQGRLHNPEFTLLEWYRSGFNYHQLMDEVESLINMLSQQTNVYARFRYAEIMLKSATIDINSIRLTELRQKCSELVSGVNTSVLNFDQCLDLLLSFVIAPQMKGYVFVYDYPVSQASLAKPAAGNPLVAERFELFHNGLELANGFSELTDAVEQRLRFEEDNRKRVVQGLKQYPLDELFLAALHAGLPDCAGVALGLDRLLMVLLGTDSIEEVLSFKNY